MGLDYSKREYGSIRRHTYISKNSIRTIYAYDNVTLHSEYMYCVTIVGASRGYKKFPHEDLARNFSSL